MTGWWQPMLVGAIFAAFGGIFAGVALTAEHQRTAETFALVCGIVFASIGGVLLQVGAIAWGVQIGMRDVNRR